MMIREFINKPQDLLALGKKLLQTSDDRVFSYRITMVNLLLAENGPTTAELSELSGVPTRTLTDWVKKADETLFEALRPQPHPGKTPRLTEEQYAQIKEALTHEPEKFGYQVWDGKALSDYIQKTYGVTLGVRQCQRIFHKLGFSRIRPQIFPALGEEDSEEREAFKKNGRHKGKQECSPRLSGRSTLPADCFGVLCLGIDWKPHQSKVRTWKKEHRIQWFCSSVNRCNLGQQTRLVHI